MTTDKNYFKVLNLPEKLLLNHNELKKNYFVLLKESANELPVDASGKKKKGSEKKKLIEEAYQTLKDRLTRIEHLLEIQGVAVANDNKVPSHLAPLVEKMESLLIRIKTDKTCVTELKKIHTNILSEFSLASIELARLEQAWDSSTTEGGDILRKLRRKMTAFNYIRSLEQNVRSAMA